MGQIRHTMGGEPQNRLSVVLTTAFALTAVSFPISTSSLSEAWQLLDCSSWASRYPSDRPRWTPQVPWGGKQVTLGMVAWAASFLLVGVVVSPLAVKTAGVTVSPVPGIVS